MVISNIKIQNAFGALLQISLVYTTEFISLNSQKIFLFGPILLPIATLGGYETVNKCLWLQLEMDVTRKI